MQMIGHFLGKTKLISVPSVQKTFPRHCKRHMIFEPSLIGVATDKLNTLRPTIFFRVSKVFNLNYTLYLV